MIILFVNPAMMVVQPANGIRCMLWVLAQGRDAA